MKTLAMTLAFLAGLPLALSAQVSKEDIKKLASAGISDEVILSYVKANGPVARLSAEDLIELKQAGASEKLLSVILGAPAPAPAAERPVERQVVTRPVVVDSTPYYYTPSSCTCDSYPSAPCYCRLVLPLLPGLFPAPATLLVVLLSALLYSSLLPAGQHRLLDGPLVRHPRQLRRVELSPVGSERNPGLRPQGRSPFRLCAGTRSATAHSSRTSSTSFASGWSCRPGCPCDRSPRGS